MTNLKNITNREMKDIVLILRLKAKDKYISYKVHDNIRMDKIDLDVQDYGDIVAKNHPAVRKVMIEIYDDFYKLYREGFE